MAEQRRLFKIFVGAPSDCDDFRGLARAVVASRTVQSVARHVGAVVEIRDWEDIPGNHGRPQGIIDDDIRVYDPDWMVLVFWHRIGKEAGRGMTGTEEEYRLAGELNARGNGRPAITVFVNRADPPSHKVEGEQLAALQRLLRSIESGDLLVRFRGRSGFENDFRDNLVERLLRSTPPQVANMVISGLRNAFWLASEGLVNWPKTLGPRRHIVRPEAADLMERIRQREDSTTIVIGPRGVGKSALLSYLSGKVSEEGTVVLGIKADMLDPTISSLDDLGRAIGLEMDLADAIRTVASQEPVVVLVDQLDALGEIVDQHPGRLSAVLEFIRAVTGIPRVHMIASVREFEYLHDIRLQGLGAEELRLGALEWVSVAEVLGEAGHDPEILADAPRELLAVPLHLKLFLELAKPGDVFESLQALLEELWRQRVTSPEQVEVLERLAVLMAREEVLWLPTSAGDPYLTAVRALERAEILTRGQRGTTLGFRHQCYYDHALARAFAAERFRLPEFVRERQDGVFVRPVLRSSLQFLRATNRTAYHMQIQQLVEMQPRQHIMSLLIGFLGSQLDPDDVELDVVSELLRSTALGPQVLAAMSGTPGWFRRLSHHPRFHEWMQMEADRAIFTAMVLVGAIKAMPSEVVRLMAALWTGRHSYSGVVVQVLSQLEQWDAAAVVLAEDALGRTSGIGAEMLIAQVVEVAPEWAPRLLKASLQRQLDQELAGIGGRVS